MIHLTIDDALINSAYLSELWAVRDLSRFKEQFPNRWDTRLDEQLEDEIGHVNILKQLLIDKSTLVVESLDFSMQNQLYKKIAGIDLCVDNYDEFLEVQVLMEKRAVWIYKLYNRFGSDEKYKDVIRSILTDEVGHIIEIKNKTSFGEQVVASEKKIFKEYIPQKYGNVMAIITEPFWSDYFNDQFS